MDGLKEKKNILKQESITIDYKYEKSYKKFNDTNNSKCDTI